MKLRNHSGGASIEFIIVLPILLLLMAAFVDFGMAFHNKQVLTNASREGARAGIVNLKDDDGEKIPVTDERIRELVLDYAFDDDGPRLLNVEGPEDIGTQVSRGGANYPADLTVRVTLDYEPLLSPLLEFFGGNFDTFDISAVTVMRLE